MARRRIFLRLGGAAALAGTGLSVRAQPAWPSRPVKIVVPFASGGPADVYARAVGQKLQEALGQPFVIEDRPGAGSVVGTDYAAKSPADGYTLLLMSNAHTVNETLLPNKPFSLTRDFTGIAPINYSDLVLVAHPSVPATSLKDLIRLAKEKPGRFNYASSGPGTPYHMAGELFKSMAGIHLLHIPYKGSSAARTDVLGGQVDMMFDAVTTMAEHVRAGKVRALGTTGLQRSSVLPEVPTVSEAGVPGYEATIWLGLVAPRGTPRPVIDKLNETMTQITSQPELRQLWARQGATPMAMPVAAFDKYIQDDIAKWARVIRTANIKVD